MKTQLTTAIEFNCPRCSQSYRARDRAPGSDIVCSVCQHPFQVPGDLEAWQDARAEEESAAPKETEEEREIRLLFNAASETNFLSNCLLLIAIPAFLFCLAALCDDLTGRAVKFAAISFGSFIGGILFKIVAQLKNIRAELRLARK